MSKMSDIMSAQSTRETLEGLPCPICTKSVSSTQLIQLQLDSPCAALTCFETLLDEEEDPELEAALWEAAWQEAFEKATVVDYELPDYELPYYEDMED